MMMTTAVMLPTCSELIVVPSVRAGVPASTFLLEPDVAGTQARRLQILFGAALWPQRLGLAALLGCP